ncbi:MAG TPA: S8 family peptidase [Candidatus Tyrphobacter sp.]
MHRRVIARFIALAASSSMLLSACTGGGGGGNPGGGGGHPTPPPPNPAYTCPTSDTQTSEGRGGISPQSLGSGDAARRFVARAPQQTITGSTVAIGVTYDRAIERGSQSAIASREQRLGATFAGETDLAHLGLVGRTLIVPTAQLLSVESSLRAQSGVKAVGVIQRRYPTTITGNGFFPNDPYFDGFAPDNTPPLYEGQAIPGQWDMHVIGLEKAFEYSQSGNGSGLPANPNALGSSSVKIALIDTGQDTTHPELHTKVTYQKCYVTNPSNVQSISNFTTDPQGHGTDTAGLAAEDMNNALGFVGAGGNVVIYGYRVFPEPDDTCAGPNGDSQCSADTRDIASAVNDAVAQHVNVISISLGGGSCTGGVDPDPFEGPAVQAAITAGVTVVAASGNGSLSTVDAPACANGVIAAGATSLADGMPNGSAHSGGTASNPIEYVASYSNAGATNTLHSTASWGIVAPGGDPSSNTDADDLHWIENIWTSLPFDSKFAGECTDDYPNGTGTTPPVDCRILVAGTSMATPRVAGVAALILSIGNASYSTPAQIKMLLCSTADDLGDARQGCGRINAYRAMAYAVNDPVKP